MAFRLEYDQLIERIRECDVAGLEKLLAEGISLKQPWYRKLLAPSLPSPLIAAVYANSTEIASLLIRYNADVDDGMRNVGTPLAFACGRGNIDMVSILLDSGADIDKKLSGSGTPVEQAAWRGKEEIVTLLLEKGADPHPPLRRDAGSLLRIPSPILYRLLKASTQRFPEAEAILAADRSFRRPSPG